MLLPGGEVGKKRRRLRDAPSTRWDLRQVMWPLWVSPVPCVKWVQQQLCSLELARGKRVGFFS